MLRNLMHYMNKMKTAVYRTARGAITQKIATFEENVLIITIGKPVGGKGVSLNFFICIDIHMVLPTAAEDIIERSCPKTGTTVPMFTNACTEYNGGRLVHGDKTKPLLHHYRYHRTEVNPTQKS